MENVSDIFVNIAVMFLESHSISGISKILVCGCKNQGKEKKNYNPYKQIDSDINKNAIWIALYAIQDVLNSSSNLEVTIKTIVSAFLSMKF